MQKSVSQLPRENKRLGFSECYLRAVGNFHGFFFFKNVTLKISIQIICRKLTLQCHISFCHMVQKEKWNWKSRFLFQPSVFPQQLEQCHGIGAGGHDPTPCLRKENSKYTLLESSASGAGTRTDTGAPASASCLLRKIKCTESKRMWGTKAAASGQY